MCIDLKSFYASVECKERNLDPLVTNLVVADEERTDKTVCLAVTPSLKQYGLGGRARLFEVRSKVKEINYERRKNNYYRKFTSKSCNDLELKKNKNLELDFIIAKPRMRYYMDYSTRIYNIYLKYFSKDDIFVYSIDEVFIDATNYLNYYKLSPEKLMTKVIKDVYLTTGITATGGIGSNLFLAKIAMDVVAKHVKANSFGVRIASLDESSYRRLIWNHKPITDIWRVGNGIANSLSKHNMYTMGDIALCSLENEDLLYDLFGVNAELLIDHAWGYEPCTMKDVKSYKPQTKSLGSGQVLHEPYSFNDAKIIVMEMCDALALDLVNKKLLTKQLTLTINYDVTSLDNPKYFGEIVTDSYGRKVPKSAHGTVNLDNYSYSSSNITKAVIGLYNRITNPILLIRKISISANNLEHEENVKYESKPVQIDLFSNIKEMEKEEKETKKNELEDKKVQEAMIKIKNKYGKNAILKGLNYEEKATGRQRNKEVGGHHE